MKNKLFFDTLNYAKLLENEGIEHASSFAYALAQALAQNIYTKSEIDKMVEAALKRTDLALKETDEAIKSFNSRTEEMERRTQEMKEEFKELKREMQETREEFRRDWDKLDVRTQKLGDDIHTLRGEMNQRFQEFESRIVTRLYGMFGVITAFLALNAAITHFFH